MRRCPRPRLEIGTLAVLAWITLRCAAPDSRAPTAADPRAGAPDGRQPTREGEPEDETPCADLSGDPNAWIRCLREAVALSERSSDSRQRSALLNDLGNAHHRLGSFDEALTAYRRSLALAQSLGSLPDQAETLNDLGMTYRAWDQPGRALELYYDALEIWRRLGWAYEEAITLHNVGIVFSRLDRLEDARVYLGRALALLPDEATAERARTRTEIARILHRQGDPEAALGVFRQVLAAQKAPEHRADRAATLDGIGTVHWQAGRLQPALQAYREALAIYRQLERPAYEADVLANIGRLHESSGDPDEALANSRLAIEEFERAGIRDGKAHALYVSARAERLRGHLDAAYQLMQEVLAIIESLRAKPALRARFFASRHVYYEFTVDLLMQLHELRPDSGFDEIAFGATERSRARGFLAELGEERSGTFQSLPPELRDRRDRLIQLINASHLEQEALAGAAARPAEAARAGQLRELMLRWEALQSEMQRSDPGYARQPAPEILSLRQVQRRLLDDETQLLAYSLGTERSYLWWVTAETWRSFALPGRSEVEKSAARVYRLFGASHLVEAEAQFREAAARLSDMLLGPVAPHLTDQQLMIIADGALQYLPFGALPKPLAVPGAPRLWQASIDRPRPLLRDHLVVHLPSASVFDQLERRLAGRPRASEGLAIFADPVFGADDPRVTSTSVTAPDDEAELRSELGIVAAGVGLSGFERLPFTEREARSISALITGDRPFEALGFAAHKDELLRTDLSRYRILHFATHGVLHPTHPELSGLVLSSIDRQGMPRDAFLRAYEIYGLHLAADLVVLSACRTALGEAIRGEGLIGLTRGFMHAGAARVLVSLWNVNDAATAVLMERFYRQMIEAGLSPAAALRAAQLSMLDEKRWRAPYFWAGFLLQGKAHQKTRARDSSNNFLLAVSIGPEIR